MSLTLSARTLSGVESENSVLSAPAGESVILVLESNEVFLGDITWTVDGAARTPASTIANASGQIVAAFPFDGGPHKYQASARVEHDEPITSNEVLVVGTPGHDSVAEISIGQYDERFAERSGSVLAGLACAVVLVLLLVSLLTLLPTDDGAATGTWIERVRAVVVIGIAAAGVIALLAGVWMAVLEVRGRLRSTVQISAPTSDDSVGSLGTDGGSRVDVGSVVGELRDTLTSTVREFRTARGTIVAIVTGTLLLLLALLGSSSFDVSFTTGGGDPAPTPAPVVEVPPAG